MSCIRAGAEWVCACIDVAEALGYVERVERLLLEELDQVRAILVRFTM